MYLFVLSLSWLFYIVSTIRSSTKCSVEPCTHSLVLNCISNEDTCYNFQTMNGTNFCAPTSSCELLDLCDQNGYCLSKTSVCVINSCCVQPVCLPLVLLQLCSPNNLTKINDIIEIESYTTTTTSQSTTTSETKTSSRLIQTTTTTKVYSSNKNQLLKKLEFSTSILYPKICSNAYWNKTSIIVASFPDLNPKDFFLNQYNEIYIPDKKNHLIRKYLPENINKWINAFNSTFSFDPEVIFIDNNQNIYIWDTKTYSIYLWSSINQNIQTILSFEKCKISIEFNYICFANSLFVDLNQSIYITESSNKYFHTNRIMKFEANQTIGRIIAGSSKYGSGNRQLNLPRTIYVNSKGILYVGDIGNGRIQEFILGNRNGTTILSIENLTDFLIDEDGNFYVMIQSEKVVKQIKKKSIDEMKPNVILSFDQATRMHFGIDGSIYLLNEVNQTIEKFQIVDNYC